MSWMWMLSIAVAAPDPDLALAARVGDLYLAADALEAGADAQTALPSVLMACDGPMAELLAAWGAKPEGPEARRPLQCPTEVAVGLAGHEPWGPALLMEAAGDGELFLVRALLEAGVPAAPEALSASLARRREATARALLDAGAEVTSGVVAAGARAGVDGLAQPLVRALDGSELGAALVLSATGSEAYLEALLARGAALDATDGMRGPPLLEAAAAGQLARVEGLLARGAPVDAVRMDGRTALMVAGAHPAVVERLLAAGADARARLPTGWTALHGAARQSPESVGLLLDAGAEVDAAMASSGETPLHQAARSGRPAIVDRLLEAGADASLTTRTPDGELTPADLARAAGHEALGDRLAASAP